MNWKERFLPTNATEAGCLALIITGVFITIAYFLDALNQIPRIAMALWLSFYVYRFGVQAQVDYQVPKRTAFIVSGVMVAVYFLIWLGILVMLAFGFSNLINQVNSLILFVFGTGLAIALYFHMIRFKQTVFEKWLGWQPKEG